VNAIRKARTTKKEEAGADEESEGEFANLPI
jgi:hypothetical protein